ncbi:phage tail protein [Pantoea sp. LMR881]|uniref:phage tail protein n=1 Tax=Pantoea sp. LMR881 TaxID=3014336 RepID=UPI0022AF299A|nr:phage tail protein [Pantoea sp. LMR881]MCZ4061241.1 phage tail protein [Pantoea sp. LMR881]
MAAITAVTGAGKLFRAALLDYFYTRRAESEIGLGNRFKYVKAYFGTSALVTKNPAGGWTVAEIPLKYSLSDLQNKFAEAELICTADEGLITVTATLQDAVLPADTAYDFNTLMLLDADDKAFAVLCCQQDTLYQGKAFTAKLTIDQRAN